MRPLSVLKSEKMEALLYEIHLAEAVMNVRKVSTNKEIQRSYYDYIFEKHHTTREQFEKSIKWYAANPKKLELIYTNVKERVEKLQVDVNNYVYHPEVKELEANKMLDTVQLVKFEKHYYFKNYPPKDSLAFKIEDRNYFAFSDRFILRFLMQAEVFDNKTATLPNSKNFLTVTYSNGKQKTAAGKIPTDNKWYRYTLQVAANDSVIPIKIHGNLFDGNDMIRALKIDSVELIKIYNSEKEPLPDSIKTILGMDILKKDLPETAQKSDTVVKMPVEFQNFRRRNLPFNKAEMFRREGAKD
jgi:hypothetical protein